MSKRTLKYKIISKSEDAPVVGSVVEEKDTIFVKQITATEFELYASDETGYVVKLHEYAITNEKFRMLILEYLNNFSAEIKNTLNHSNTISVPVHFNDELKEAKIKVVKKDNREVIYTLKAEAGPLYLDEGDVVRAIGEPYTDNYLSVNTFIVGKELIDPEDPIDTAQGIHFGTINYPNLTEGEAIIRIVGLNSSDVSIKWDDGSHIETLTEGENKISISNLSSDAIGTLKIANASYGNFTLINGIGEELEKDYESNRDEIRFSIPLNKLRGLYILSPSFYGA